MFKVFGAIGRFFRAVLYTFAGNVSYWSQIWESNASFIDAEYDDFEKEGKQNINQLTNAVAEILGLVKEKEDRQDIVTDKIADLKEKLTGAKAAGEKRANLLKQQGKTIEEIKLDPEIIRFNGWNHDFTTTLATLQEEEATIKKELETYQTSLSRYKVKLELAHAELKKIKVERIETKADLAAAESARRVNEALLGIGESKSAERRQRIQENRRKTTNRAAVQGELAGIATHNAEDEFLKYARENESSGDFFEAIGLGDTKEEKVTQEPHQIPEA